MKTAFLRMKRTMAAENDAARRSLNDLRVIDLRSALEKRSLDKSGVKSVLLQRLQKALEEDGVDPENFYSEVMKDSTPARKPKRTNKKLTRDDESETHSNVDDSLQNDLSLELDSDDDRMDKGLEATDVVEDAINLSIEEEEKLLTEEDDGIAEREEKEEKAVEGKATAPAATKIESANGKPPVLVVTLSEQDSLELGPSSRTTTLFNGDKQKSDEGHSGHCKDKSAAPASSSKNNADSSQASETSDFGKDAAVAKGDKKSEGDADGSSSAQKTTASDASKRNEKPSAGDTTPTDGDASRTGDGGDKSEKEASPCVGNVKVDKKEEGHKEDAAAPSATAASGQSAKTSKSITTANRDAKSKVRVRPKKAGSAINSKNLWVSGLSSSTRATDLKNLFSKYGKVIGAKIVTNAHAPVSRYYGFVTMASSEEATKCIEHLHRIELHGRMISVEKAKKEPVSQQKAGAKTAVKKETKTTSVKVATESAQQKETKVKESEAESVATDDAIASKDVKELEKHEEVAKKEDVAEKEDKEKSKEPKQDVEVSKEAKSAPKAASLSSKSRSKSRDGHSKEAQASSSNFTYANAERIRQRQREEEREMREVERRRHQDFLRQKDIERKQREEAVRLERERERLRMDREKLEREKAEVLRHEREKQRMERERIEREREDLRRREFGGGGGGGGGRYDDTRRPFKRPMEPRGPREEHWGNRNKRPNLGPHRFNVGGPPGGFHGNDRGGRPEPYERVKVERYDRRPMDEDRFHDPPARRNDMGRRDPPMHHDRDERRILMRTEGVRDVGRFVRGPPPISGGGSGGGGRDRDMPRDDRDRDRDRMGPPRGDIMHMRRPSPRTDWKQNSQDRPGGSRGHHISPSSHDIGGRGDRDRYGDSSGSKGMSGSSGYGASSRSLGDNRYGSSDRGGDSWHSGGPSSSSDHRSSSKQYSSSASSGAILGGGPARESSWGGDRKVESGQSWGRNESSQGDRWGSGGIGGGMETRSIRSTQSTSISQPVIPQTGSSMYGTTSGSDTGGMMMGMNSEGSSYAGGDRYDAYKGLSGMRRY